MKILGDQQIQGILYAGRRVVEGLKAQLVDTNYNLTSRSEKFFRFVASSNCTVTLPDATTLSNGFEFVFYTTSDGITLNDFSGSKIQYFEPGVLYYCYLMDNSTQKGDWVVSMDTSYDIAVGEDDSPSKGVRAYFKIVSEYTGVLDN